MRTMFLIASGLMVSACQPASGPVITEPASAPAAIAGATAAPTTQGVTFYAQAREVYKVCDEGRAIYVFDGYRAGGLGIVENADECPVSTAMLAERERAK